jgi:hypothetical protein
LRDYLTIGGCLRLLEFSCPKCAYKQHLLVGTQDPSQTFSDLNEDFAYYRLFLCPEGREIHSFDIHDREFEGDCPKHKVKLKPLTEVPKTCPKCEGTVQVTEEEILKTERGN